MASEGMAEKLAQFPFTESDTKKARAALEAIPATLEAGGMTLPRVAFKTGRFGYYYDDVVEVAGESARFSVMIQAPQAKGWGVLDGPSAAMAAIARRAKEAKQAKSKARTTAEAVSSLTPAQQKALAEAILAKFSASGEGEEEE